jgi:SagB-type dehydrogenase family enzyme
MTSEEVLWTYALASDVKIESSHGGALLLTATNQMWINAAEFEVIQRLTRGENSEADLQRDVQLNEFDPKAKVLCAAVLFRLDRAGLLARSLVSYGHRLVSCLPLRAPPGPPPQSPPNEAVRLSPNALARAETNAVSIEVPGSWARMTLHDRHLLPLLHDLSVRRQTSELTNTATGHSPKAILALLGLMSWCNLLDRGEDEAWSAHDLLFHTRTRAGYTRVLRGKNDAGGREGAQPAPSATLQGLRRISLEQPDLLRLLAEDPPYALVSERRQSVRRQGSMPPTLTQLSEFLFRTLHQRFGRRPYPSGGACYPLKAYVAVHDCLGMARGLYAYDPDCHELVAVGEPGIGFERLLADAAGAAGVDLPPQILLILAAQYVRTQQVYPDISYSLILKEVGAVFQVAMMAAAAMELSTCPLGCGDALLFSELVGVNSLIESSVGELMLGSREDKISPDES